MEKKIVVEATMEERWVPYFLSMLKHMETLGEMGSNAIVGIYSDGDGDFRPKFKTDTEFELQKPTDDNGRRAIYDAG